MVRGQRAGCGERHSRGPRGGERDRHEPGKGTDADRGKTLTRSGGPGKGPTRAGGRGPTLAGEEGSGTHRKFAVSSRLLDGCQRREDPQVASGFDLRKRAGEARDQINTGACINWENGKIFPIDARRSERGSDGRGFCCAAGRVAAQRAGMLRSPARP